MYKVGTSLMYPRKAKKVDICLDFAYIFFTKIPKLKILYPIIDYKLLMVKL